MLHQNVSSLGVECNNAIVYDVRASKCILFRCRVQQAKRFLMYVLGYAMTYLSSQPKRNITTRKRLSVTNKTC